MKYLMGSLDEISENLGDQKLILLLDYDGTLTPIVGTPDKAILHDDMRTVLEEIKEDPNIILAIISGRSLEDVKSKVRINGICYAGNHGMEIEYKDKLFVFPDAKTKMDVIKKICAELNPLLKGIEGVIIENKGLTASVHYRMAPPTRIHEVKSIARTAFRPYIESGDIRITHGKMVLEIRPNIPWDKGKAVLWVLSAIEKEAPQKHATIYIGDDRTDEDAFKALKGTGITVLVSSKTKNTDAEFVLYRVNEVKSFLLWLVN